VPLKKRRLIYNKTIFISIGKTVRELAFLQLPENF